MRRGHALSILLVLAQAGVSVSAEDPERSFLLSTTDDVANVAGIGILADTPIPKGATEVRIWTGFGIVTPEHLLRFQISSDGQVRGQLLVHFHINKMADVAGNHERNESVDQSLSYEVMRTCENLRRSEGLAVCTATFAEAPNWKATYKKLQRLGIETLPDESELPEPDVPVFDGSSVVVEVRHGAQYRHYDYSNPAFRQEPEAQAAAKIMATVGRLAGESQRD